MLVYRSLFVYLLFLLSHLLDVFGQFTHSCLRPIGEFLSFFFKLHPLECFLVSLTTHSLTHRIDFLQHIGKIHFKMAFLVGQLLVLWLLLLYFFKKLFSFMLPLVSNFLPLYLLLLKKWLKLLVFLLKFFYFFVVVFTGFLFSFVVKLDQSFKLLLIIRFLSW